MMKNVNPFNITKAVDYSDAEIDTFWVDIPGGNGFIDLLKPDSSMPMMILGGKGSGKTHLMRYFSFNLQIIRYGDTLKSDLEKDGYVGVFLRCGGLNSSKFSGSNQTSDAWRGIFSYYFELWLSQLVVNIIVDISSKLTDIDHGVERKTCNQIASLFDVDVAQEFRSFLELRSYLQKLQRQVDFEVNNCAITGNKISDLRILVSPGKLVFGLPKILRESIPLFNNIQFLYLIDEYENLLEYQQCYINTLIREREDPTSFRIGARWYGIKTYSTYSGQEELKVGSEYEKVIIDQLLRERKGAYNEFANQIFFKRLEKTGYLGRQNRVPEMKISEYFVEFDLDVFFNRLATKEKSVWKSYFKTLRANLKTKTTDKVIDKIIANLSCDENPLVERTNVLLFHRAWNNGSKDLLASSERIKSNAREYLSNQSDKSTLHNKILDKFKGDIIDQLHRDSREKIMYVGIEKIIKMSAGIPRLFLIMLKHMYRWSIYNGEQPFGGTPISMDAQQKGIEDAMKWFLDDARVPGPSGRPIANTIDRIGQLLHEIRFSDVPPECSLSSFSINVSDIDEDVENILNYLEQYSYLIRGSERREKNSSVRRITYQINGLISPQWELPVFTRGILELNSSEVLAIFSSQSDEDFQKVKTERWSRYNAPFKNNIQPSLTLFDDNDD